MEKQKFEHGIDPEPRNIVALLSKIPGVQDVSRSEKYPTFFLLQISKLCLLVDITYEGGKMRVRAMPYENRELVEAGPSEYKHPLISDEVFMGTSDEIATELARWIDRLNNDPRAQFPYIRV